VRYLIHTFPARVVEHTYGGHRLKVYLTDPLAQGWYDHDWPPLPEVLELQKGRLRPGALVFDIGAHQGVVAAMLAMQVGPTGRIVAVEANAHNCRAAVRNRELNGLTQIEIVHAAVVDRPGRIDFNEGLNGQLDDGSGSRGRVSVEAITLDSLAERFGLPDVVFLDIEGAEYLALLGGPRVLASDADFFVEVHVGCGLERMGGSAAAVLEQFPQERYERLVRAEADPAFRPLIQDDPLTQNRFFLVARARSQATKAEDRC
jgi:FkbM family methyltransferase